MNSRSSNTSLIIGGVVVNPGPTELAKLEEKLNKITEMLGKHADDTRETRKL